MKRGASLRIKRALCGLVKRVVRSQKVKTTGAKSRMVYSAHSATGPPRSRRLRRRQQTHGNVLSLLEAFRPNGFDRRVPGLPKAERGARDNLDWGSFAEIVTTTDFPSAR